MVVRRERGKMRADPQSITTRPTAVAGVFYDDDPDRLRTQVLNLLTDVTASTKVMPKALIAPHAGYVYSGRARPVRSICQVLASYRFDHRPTNNGPSYAACCSAIRCYHVDVQPVQQNALVRRCPAVFGVTHGSAIRCARKSNRRPGPARPSRRENNT